MCQTDRTRQDIYMHHHNARKASPRLLQNIQLAVAKKGFEIWNGLAKDCIYNIKAKSNN